MLSRATLEAADINGLASGSGISAKSKGTLHLRHIELPPINLILDRQLLQTFPSFEIDSQNGADPWEYEI
jgi:hypothetical protein